MSLSSRKLRPVSAVPLGHPGLAMPAASRGRRSSRHPEVPVQRPRRACGRYKRRSTCKRPDARRRRSRRCPYTPMAQGTRSREVILDPPSELAFPRDVTRMETVANMVTVARLCHCEHLQLRSRGSGQGGFCISPVVLPRARLAADARHALRWGIACQLASSLVSHMIRSSSRPPVSHRRVVAGLGMPPRPSGI